MPVLVISDRNYGDKSHMKSLIDLQMIVTAETYLRSSVLDPISIAGDPGMLSQNPVCDC